MSRPKTLLKKLFKTRESKLLLGILLVGFFLRIYKLDELFFYGHDNDLAGWVVKDVVVNKHLRLVGQETSTRGIFIGPLYYYLLIPFYLLTGMDPIGGAFLVTFLGILSIYSCYFVVSRAFSKRGGLIAAFIYATSIYTVLNDREVVPTMPVMLWSIWFLYALHLVLNRKYSYGLIIFGLLSGLIWHLNVSLVLVFPLVPIAILLSKSKPKLKDISLGLLTFLGASLPLIAFELKHNLLQTRALVAAFSTSQGDIVSGWEKVQRTLLLLGKNFSSLFWAHALPTPHKFALYLLAGLGVYLFYKKLISRQWAVLVSLWLVAYVVFFSFYSKILSEYYLNGTIIVAIILLSLFVDHVYSQKSVRWLAILLLSVFAAVHSHRLFTADINESGYVEKKAVVKAIKEDAQKHGFPCVSVSYITNPGYEFGYRYFYWLEDMHVNRPDSGSPVYSIVFPQKPIFPQDASFGAIGLIYPEYSRYTKESVEKSCSGANSNLTDPMFGYTQ